MNKLLKLVIITSFALAFNSAQAQDARKNTILINTFTVPATMLNETIAMWEIARDFLDDQPGYVSTKLHKSLSPDAKYQLINVAEWESADAFKEATAKLQKAKILPHIEGVIPGPHLYTVIRD